jgi:hypothetical protein
MADEAGEFEARREKLKELERLLQQGEVPMLRRRETEGFEDLPFLMVNGAHYESCLPGTVHAQKGLDAAFSLDKACEISPNHIQIKIPGRKAVCFADISDAETVGTMTEKIAESLGVDKRNWGFYAMEPKKQLEFLRDNAKLSEIKIDHNRNLHFLPRTAIK